jgi:diketogulonate reductase-like aldo/keto reductase
MTSAVLEKRIPSSAPAERVPVVGLGTWKAYDVGPSPSARAPLEAALSELAAEGGRLVDSSPMYGRAEEVVGEIVEKLGLRPRLFVATKVWTTGRAEGIRQMEESIAKLRAETLDLIAVHNLVDVDTQLATLRDWKARGRIRYLGVTHYAASAHDAVARIVEKETLDFLQINYSVAEPEAERRLLPLARDRGVAVIVNRPLGGGRLARSLAGRPVPSWAEELGCESWPQLLLKFVVSHPAVTCAIPGSGDAGHVRANVAAGRGPMPDEDTRARIRAAARNAA